MLLHRIVAAAALLAFVAPPVAAAADNCVANLNDIVLPEIALASNAAATAKERIYILCPNTVFYIGEPGSGNGLNYTGGSLPLAIFNPNLSVLCGADGSVKNNCVLLGGDHQVLALSHDMMPSDLKAVYPDASNFRLSGVTMRNAKDLAFSIASAGTDIHIQDCVFENHAGGSFVAYMDSPEAPIPVQRRRAADERPLQTTLTVSDAQPVITITFDGCVFQHNVALLSIVGAIGLVHTKLTSNTFSNNTVPDNDSGVGCLLWFTDGSGSIRNNCMYDNQYALSNTLVNGGVFELIDNFAADKSRYQTVGCDGYMFVAKADSLGNALDTGSFTCADYDSTECVRSAVLETSGVGSVLAGTNVFVSSAALAGLVTMMLA